MGVLTILARLLHFVKQGKQQAEHATGTTNRVRGTACIVVVQSDELKLSPCFLKGRNVKLQNAVNQSKVPGPRLKETLTPIGGMLK